MVFPGLPEWLLACVVCADLTQVFRGSAANCDRSGTLAAFDAMRAHLVADHLDRLPAYVPGCALCDQSRGIACHDSGDVRALVVEDLRHRAEHLII